mmetsp:Transcript_10769/g.26767  ORF Transcript_10769/g.26767 Transcript_10769/m.26767 type:complete len:250 (-) Transcript_10769:245-994(-)
MCHTTDSIRKSTGLEGWWICWSGSPVHSSIGFPPPAPLCRRRGPAPTPARRRAAQPHRLCMATMWHPLLLGSPDAPGCPVACACGSVAPTQRPFFFSRVLAAALTQHGRAWRRASVRRPAPGPRPRSARCPPRGHVARRGRADGRWPSSPGWSSCRPGRRASGGRGQAGRAASSQPTPPPPAAAAHAGRYARRGTCRPHRRGGRTRQRTLGRRGGGRCAGGRSACGPHTPRPSLLPGSRHSTRKSRRRT